MKKILILGASVYQVPLIKTAKRMGLYTIVASIPGDYPGFALADKVYHINTVDKEAILEMAVKEEIDGICTTGTDVAVATIGYVCEHRNLPGVSEEAAIRATDKAKMKEAFGKGNVSAARFQKVTSLEEVYQAADEIGQDFLFAYQRAVLLTLQRQGFLNEMQCRNCVQKLEEQTRNTGKSKSVKE